VKKKIVCSSFEPIFQDDGLEARKQSQNQSKISVLIWQSWTH
jgi:hypothetical protein